MPQLGYQHWGQEGSLNKEQSATECASLHRELVGDVVQDLLIPEFRSGGGMLGSHPGLWAWNSCLEEEVLAVKHQGLSWGLPETYLTAWGELPDHMSPAILPAFLQQENHVLKLEPPHNTSLMRCLPVFAGTSLQLPAQLLPNPAGTSHLQRQCYRCPVSPSTPRGATRTTSALSNIC